MSRAALVTLIAAGALALALVVWLIVGAFRSPIHAEGGRTCIGCVELHTGATSRVQAGTLTGTYRFRDQIDYVIRFEAGTVAYDGTMMEPGCHVRTANIGDRIRFDGASDVLLEAPAPEDACA